MALTPLASSAQFQASAYANMAVDLQTGELDRIMLVATRACEAATGCLLAPFTITETTRLQDGDVEDIVPTGMPLTHQAQMGLDYARAINMPAMVRHFSVRNYPRCHQDMWTGAVSQIQVYWALQAAPFTVPAAAVAFFPDTGQGVFNVGTFVPPGTTGAITYSGGFASNTTPENLVQSCLDMAGAEVMKMLDPAERADDIAALRHEALRGLVAYGAKSPTGRR